MSLVTVDAGFLNRLLELMSHCKAAADGIGLVGQRTWMYPPASTWSGNPLDVAGMQQAFDRSQLNELYMQAVCDPLREGKVGDLAAAKTQIDYTAVMSRAFSTRHSTRIRNIAHNTARKYGHGNQNGVLVGSVVPYVQSLVDRANDVPPQQ